MLDAAAGPSRAHRLRLLRAGDAPLRARELQGFRFRAAAHPGAACSYAMQEQARGGLSARTRRRLGGPEPTSAATGERPGHRAGRALPLDPPRRPKPAPSSKPQPTFEPESAGSMEM